MGNDLAQIDSPVANQLFNGKSREYSPGLVNFRLTIISEAMA